MITYIGINGRDDIPRFLTEEQVKGEGVEIGTHRGIYAQKLLEGWSGKLYCVDPWNEAPDYEDQVHLLTGGTDRHNHEKEARQLLQPYTDAQRCFILKQTSENAALRFKNNTLAFVYIDGNHNTWHVLNDLDTWYPKIYPGGYIFGHDFVYGGDNRNHGWGRYIQNAVQGFCTHFDLDYSIIPDGTDPWSFVIRKPL